MRQPVNSFLHFVIGFLTFISVSFGVTFVVQKMAIAKDLQDQTAAAAHAVVGN
jgi:hypothetical protein